MQFELSRSIGSLHRRVVPTILLYVIVLASVKLDFVVRVVATKRVDSAAKVDGCEECLLLRLVLPHFDCLAVVVQIVVLDAIPSNQVVAFLVCDIHLSEVSRERLSVSAGALPLELHACRLCTVLF